MTEEHRKASRVMHLQYESCPAGLILLTAPIAVVAQKIPCLPLSFSMCAVPLWCDDVREWVDRCDRGKLRHCVDLPGLSHFWRAGVCSISCTSFSLAAF